MKDIKSMIIGFLLATCLFLFMGATDNDSMITKEIILEEPLKQTGNHFVHIDLGNDLKPKVKVKISAKK